MPVSLYYKLKSYFNSKSNEIIKENAAIKMEIEAIKKEANLNYHIWYYNNEVWKTTTFIGVPCYKSVSDMWSYQEIINELKPSLIIEFGTFCGGSILFFSTILKMVKPNSKAFSVDINHENVPDFIKNDSHIELMKSSSTDGCVEKRIRELRCIYVGPVFAILDSDHKKEHVLAEMEMLKNILVKGDYLVVEDGNINGHPVRDWFGPGPMEAIEEYFSKYPNDYQRDIKRENKFGFTFAPKGFLIRN